MINTQAVSASFLRDPRDATKRYSFFLRAANLEPLKVDYRHGYEEKARMEERLARHGTRRSELERELEEAEKRALTCLGSLKFLEINNPLSLSWMGEGRNGKLRS